AAEPIVRVGVALGDTSLAIGSGDRWWIHEAGVSRPIAVVDGEPGWRVVRLPFETALRLRRPDGWLSQPHVGPLVAASLGGAPVEAAGVAYPGAIEVSLRPDGTLTGVNVVPLETYLEGVVPKELGRPGADAWQAQLAQAVAARTYALKRLGSRSDLGFDLYGSVLDQAYQGLPEPADSMAVRAVRSTRGEVLLYNGYLVDAFYHSTCGGHTARVEETFDFAPAPYLIAVSDARPDGGYWCQESRYFRWTASWTAEELDATVRRNLPSLVPLPPEGAGSLVDIDEEASTPEGRALTMRVTTTTGRYVVGEDDIRRLFADSTGRILYSTQFLFRADRVGTRLNELTLVGGGWGHGVGMCQVGAMARARAGWDYRRILAAYYPGTEVRGLY
ncbi:MAG TPA: SpoIID/LytB domain-containing protein, partial [Gemmatimonadota bacterium]|nr:SpoIID/LytB domain-containing protein [Gemmatimonadota bacterium]